MKFSFSAKVIHYTVDSITSSLTEMVKQLEGLAAFKMKEAADSRAQAQQLEEKANAAHAEADKAQSVAINVSKIFNSN